MPGRSRSPTELVGADSAWGRARIRPRHVWLESFLRRAPLDDGRRRLTIPGMLVVHVQVHVKSERVAAFIEATRVNCMESLKEPGVARFDVAQQTDDPTRFVLVEVYRTPDAALAHKQTPHYAAWRDAVADMMAEPRTSLKLESLCPDPSRWSTPAT
jgi:autoinducer 2-degrading protein